MIEPLPKRRYLSSKIAAMPHIKAHAEKFQQGLKDAGVDEICVRICHLNHDCGGMQILAGEIYPVEFIMNCSLSGIGKYYIAALHVLTNSMVYIGFYPNDVDLLCEPESWEQVKRVKWALTYKRRGLDLDD